MPSAPTPDATPELATGSRGTVDDGTTAPRDGDIDPTSDAHGAGVPEQPVPAPRSPYAKMAQPTAVRNVVWALSLTMAVVIVVAILFFGVGRDLQREVPENSRVDVTASAQRAQEVAPFPVAVPEVGEGWEATGARYQDGEDPRWIIRYSAPSRGLVTMTEVTAVTPALVQDVLPGARSEGTVDVAGTACDVYVGEGDDGARGVACTVDGAAVLVHGQVDQGELVALAAPALEAARG